MKFSRIFSAINTLILRGLGSAVSVLFTIMISRHLPTDAAANFFLIFNISTIAAICFRWGLDDLIIRRVATLGREDVQRESMILMGWSHRRAGLWFFTCLTLYSLFATVTVHQAPAFLDIYSISIALCAATFVALTACGARILQGSGRTNTATVILNIAIPSLSLLGLLLLGNLKPLGARDLIHLYAVASALVYILVISLRYGNPITILSLGLRLEHNNLDVNAANKLGIVVLAQQAVGWTALLVIPFAYGDAAYRNFFVLQKVATLVSLVMLAINFTLSRQFATLFVSKAFQELRRMIFYSLTAITLASLTIAVLVIAFSRSVLFSYANVDPGLTFLLSILMASQLFFSIAALLSVVLSMANDDNYLLLSQAGINGVGAILLVITSYLLPLESAAYMLTASYFLLAVVLGARVLHLTRHPNR